MTPEVSAGNRSPNRLQVLADYVADDGAVGMVGGYTSFAGENGEADYARTSFADVSQWR